MCCPLNCSNLICRSSSFFNNAHNSHVKNFHIFISRWYQPTNRQENVTPIVLRTEQFFHSSLFFVIFVNQMIHSCTTNLLNVLLSSYLVPIDNTVLNVYNNANTFQIPHSSTAEFVRWDTPIDCCKVSAFERKQNTNNMKSCSICLLHTKMQLLSSECTHQMFKKFGKNCIFEMISFYMWCIFAGVVVIVVFNGISFSSLLGLTIHTKVTIATEQHNISHTNLLMI